MAAHSDADADAGARQAALRRLLPSGPTLDARAAIDQLDLRSRVDPDGRRPYVVLNMTSTVDGRASIGGRSGSISDRADHALFHALRAVVDAVMAGAGTVSVERYGRIIADADTRQLRSERGLSEEPLGVIVSGRVSLAPDLPLLAEPAARVVIVTGSAGSLPAGTRAHVDYVRAPRGAELDLPLALAELRQRFGVRTLLCEGGPHLNSGLLLAGVVDELLLSLSAKLAGGDGAGAESLRILAGPEFQQPIELDLLGVLESSARLFLRYGVRASAPAGASRETMLNSSLES